MVERQDKREKEVRAQWVCGRDAQNKENMSKGPKGLTEHDVDFWVETLQGVAGGNGRSGLSGKPVEGGQSQVNWQE